MSDPEKQPVEQNPQNEEEESDGVDFAEEEEQNYEDITNELENIGDYRLLPQIDCQYRSKVYLAIDRRNHEKVAIKYYDTRKDDWKSYATPLETMQALSHPNIVSIKRFIPDERYSAYVMEFYKGGDLYFKLHEGAKYTMENAMYIMWNLVCVVSYLHELGYVHGNISLENILLSSDSLEKPAAFLTGFSRCRASSINISELCNFKNDIYVAPEVSQTGIIQQSADVFALGTVFYFLILGPTEESSDDIDEKRNLPEAFKNLLSGMLQKDPGQRYKITDVMKHSFFAPHLEEIGKQPMEVQYISTLAIMKQALADAEPFDYPEDDDQYQDYYGDGVY